MYEDTEEFLMKYISTAEAAEKWGVSERSVRGYCAEGRIADAFLTGKTWNIPETARGGLLFSVNEIVHDPADLFIIGFRQ